MCLCAARAAVQAMPAWRAGGRRMGMARRMWSRSCSSSSSRSSSERLRLRPRLRWGAFTLGGGLLVGAPVALVLAHVWRAVEEERLSMHTDDEWREEDWLSVLYLAELARMCNASAERIADLQSLYGFRHASIHTRELSDVGYRYFILSSSEAPRNVQIVSLRGTANRANMMANVDTALVRTADIVRQRRTATDDDKSTATNEASAHDGTTSIPVHSGFYSIFSRVKEDILPFLRPDATIYFTGHSLGGAVSALLGIWAESLGYRVAKVVTFGMPKFTNEEGCHLCSDFPLIRVVHERDPVCRLPMSSVKGLWQGQYAHFGACLMLRGLCDDAEDVLLEQRIQELHQRRVHGMARTDRGDTHHVGRLGKVTDVARQVQERAIDMSARAGVVLARWEASVEASLDSLNSKLRVATTNGTPLSEAGQRDRSGHQETSAAASASTAAMRADWADMTGLSEQDVQAELPDSVVVDMEEEEETSQAVDNDLFVFLSGHRWSVLGSTVNSFWRNALEHDGSYHRMWRYEVLVRKRARGPSQIEHQRDR